MDLGIFGLFIIPIILFLHFLYFSKYLKKLFILDKCLAIDVLVCLSSLYFANHNIKSLCCKFCNVFNFISNLIPLDLVSKILVQANQPIITNEMISKTIFVSVLGMIISGLTLPIRSICWSLWYKNLSDVKGVDAEIVVSKPVRRVSRKSRYEKED